MTLFNVIELQILLQPLLWAYYQVSREQGKCQGEIHEKNWVLGDEDYAGKTGFPPARE
jgi:hypothetical protein